MNPIYRFRIDGDIVNPIFGDGLTKNYEQESGEQFFREKITGQLSFIGPDFRMIMGRDFGHKYSLTISVSYDGGLTYSLYCRSHFYRTNCEIDVDNEKLTVTPLADDAYSQILSGIDNEYNLIDLAPEIAPMIYEKRPVVQIYIPNRSVYGCFLGGLYWENECEPIDETRLSQLHFQMNAQARTVEVFGGNVEPNGFTLPVEGATVNQSAVFGNYRFQYDVEYDPDNVYPYFVLWRVFRNSDNVLLWSYGRSYLNEGAIPHGNYSVILSPQQSAITENLTLTFEDLAIYSRFITAKSSSTHVSLYAISDSDELRIGVPAYKYCGQSNVLDLTIASGISNTPTSYGIYEPGKYFLDPDGNGVENLSLWFPVGRNGWTRFSCWGKYTNYDWEESYDITEYGTLNDAYFVWSVIAVLLNKIAPGVTYEPTVACSQFFHDAGPDIEPKFPWTLIITPKTNFMSGGYDEAARKAPISLRSVLDMLRDCFRCYWYIDSNNVFHIEHIRYFRNGLSYTGGMTIGINLETGVESRLGIPWGYGQNKYKYDKLQMPERYQFRWMDTGLTIPFEGYPIEIISEYVNKGQINEINIGLFNADMDYVLLNPENISKDGFMIFAADEIEPGIYKPAMSYSTVGNATCLVQNVFMGFGYLQRFYAFDMAAWEYRINNDSYTARGVTMAKTQEIKFPALVDPDLFKLIRTKIGNGIIQKLSVNLSSREATATIKFEFENDTQ